jgi:hypothetical protein
MNKKDRLEKWVGKHNRKLELVRTLVNVLSFALTACVFLKMFQLL